MYPETTLPAHSPYAGQWQQLLNEHGLLDKARATFPTRNGPVPQSSSEKVSTIQNALSVLTEPDQVVELRILGVNGKKRTDSGYFTDLGRLARAALSYDGRTEGIYFTLNPVQPALIARANQRVKEYADHTTSDTEILKRITLPIDFDPVRPAGISATEQEKQAALERAWACQIWLIAQGWPEPVFADSGNGAHLLFALDLPNSEASTTLIKSCLVALSTLFSDAEVKVDISTGNASRIFKLYGTLARKGDPTPERPHRRAAIITAPATRQAVRQAQLEALVSQIPVSAKTKTAAPIATTAGSGSHDRYGKAALDDELAKLATTGSGNRNNQLFQSTAALFSLVAAGALEESEVWQALLSTAQAIGLSEQEAHHTIQSGIRRGMSQPRVIPKQPASFSDAALGNTLDIRQAHTPSAPASLPPRAVVKVSKPASDLLMHVDDLDALPPIRWLIQDYLPEDSLVEVYGAPSAGKTQVVFDMAQTLAAAGKTVIYVVAEGLRGYRSRKKAWQKFRKQAGGNLFIWREPVQLFELQSVRQFISEIQPRQPVLVVFDTLSRCSLGADENNQKDMGFILDSLDTVRRETGATVIAVHHTNAAGGRERGSTVIRGGMDIMLEVSKDDDLIAVSCAKVKDSAEFNTLYLKPVLVEIGEEQPVPVLIPAAKQVQTQADKLSSLQLEILRAVGMEMFKMSGIKCSQLDELLPPTTKRASKYYSLNNLIRLGYVAPHDKGDPYCITDAGRLKLSNAETAITASMSNMSKASPSPFIWTLPESCPMSSPIPHTSKCGMDETLDNTEITQTTGTTQQSQTAGTVLNPVNATDSVESDVQPVETKRQTTVETASANISVPTVTIHPQATGATESSSDTSYPAMSELDIMNYASQLDLRYPSNDGAVLYQIAEMISLRLRGAFEAGLGDRRANYRAEVERRGYEPPEQPIPDVLAVYLSLGIISTTDLYDGYKRACQMGHQQEFLSALAFRSEKALGCLNAMLTGNQVRMMIAVPHSPKYLDGAHRKQ